MSVLRVVPWWLRVASPPMPTAPSPCAAAASNARGLCTPELAQWQRAGSGGAEPRVRRHLVSARRQTCEPGLLPEPVGMQSRGLSWGWGLPAWSWALAKAGSAWAAVGDAQGCSETRQSAVHTPGGGSPPAWL